jgi:hypothetical protein
MKKEGLPTDEKLSLSFSSVDIREYPICIGDNPGGSGGTPLSIEWKHVSEVQLGLEEYENARPERREKNALRMGAHVRHEILRRADYSRNEISMQTKPVDIERVQRRRTVATLRYARLQELQETIFRRSINILTFGARKRKEREMMKSLMKSFASPYVEKSARVIVETTEASDFVSEV